MLVNMNPQKKKKKGYKNHELIIRIFVDKKKKKNSHSFLFSLHCSLLFAFFKRDLADYWA